MATRWYIRVELAHWKRTGDETLNLTLACNELERLGLRWTIWYGSTGDEHGERW